MAGFSGTRRKAILHRRIAELTEEARRHQGRPRRLCVTMGRPAMNENLAPIQSEHALLGAAIMTRNIAPTCWSASGGNTSMSPLSWPHLEAPTGRRGE